MTVFAKLQWLPGLALASALVFTTGCPGGDDMGGEGEMSNESMESMESMEMEKMDKMDKMEGEGMDSMEDKEKGEGMDSESMPQ